MGSKLYVGNLSYNTTSSDLEQLCAAHGTVQSAEVIQDRDTSRSKGFGFVQTLASADKRARCLKTVVMISTAPTSAPVHLRFK